MIRETHLSTTEKMEKRHRTFTSLDCAASVIPVFVILCLPMIGSRSIGGSLGTGKVAGSDGVVVTFDQPPPDPDLLSKTDHRNEGSTVSSRGGSEGDLGGGISPSNPCALVSMPLVVEDGKDGKVAPDEQKPLITISHHIFDVSHGIVPNIMYKVDVEIPPGHEFSLEYWVNGLAEERARLKRRHQRDHKDILELYLNSSSEESGAEQVIFCSKSSFGGQNKDSAASQVLSFNWFVNGNNIAVSPSMSASGLPSTVVFRLRLRAMGEISTSVFDQNLSVIVRPDCYLEMKIQEFEELTLDGLTNPQADNKGVNCTVFIVPKATFGVEIRIANFSIYGMRDICKGRFIKFTQPKLLSNFDDQKELPSSEFPTRQLTPFERKFCGKLEDYSIDERLLTFTSEFAHSRSSSNLEKTGPSRLWGTSDPSNSNPFGVFLQVNLPGSVKNREAFTLELSSVSPCQRVVLTDLDGELKYSESYENDECSIVIHVPYGNTIMTKLSLGRAKEPDEPVESNRVDPEEEGQSEIESNSINDEGDNNYSSKNNSINYYNYNDSDLDFESGESIDNSIPTTSYECPINLDVESSSGDGDNEDDNTTGGKYFLVNAVDLVSGSEFKWCFDGSSKSQALHKRAWKSSGNAVKISFRLKFFNIFHLTYQSVQIPEISGDCERGWVAMNDGCTTLVESLNSWTSAEEACQFKGGHLVTISNEDNEQNVQKIITKSALFHPSRAYWIGANDRESEGNFQWANGLPFLYKNWFMGWTHKRNEIVNAQPNDDGWSGQDCVEIRQVFDQSSSNADKPLSSMFLGVNQFGVTQLHSLWSHSRFYWNDRNCEVKNFYICERGPPHKNIDLSCNRTLKLESPQAASLTVTSPAYPSSYPDNVACITTIETVPGYRIILSFEEFVLEESPNCQYDALELLEVPTENSKRNATGISTNSKKICGDWTRKLKLLRYITSLSTTTLKLKFESDFSHRFGGYKAHVWVEKDVSEQCTDPHMKKFGAHCYLIVSFPAVNWVTAQQICTSLQGKLASVVSPIEWNFLTRSIKSNSDYNKKYTFWLGGSIDQNSQLVWSDRMPFNFSAFHQSDLQTISDWKCLTVYWYSGGKGDLAWKLADCNQLSGYICKKKAQGEVRESVNKTFSGTGGKQNSPNYPNDYYNNLDYAYHLVAPRGTQIVIRFTHLDVEDQEACLYDYVEIVDRKTKNSTRFCGTYSSKELNKLDYVSSSNEVDVLFHTDFSDTQTGFEIVWRAVDVKSCISGKTILTGLGGNGFPIHDASIHTPNFPHFNLPNLNCIYTIVAPAGQRVWLTFQIFEMGLSDSISAESCLEQDHVSIELNDLRDDSSTTSNIENEIILCGNLSTSSVRTSYISSSEKLRIRVFSPNGKSGRGFLGRFKAVPEGLVETLTLATEPNKTTHLTSLNFPLDPPETANLTVAISSPPNYVLTININGTSNCPKTVRSYLEIRDPYHGTNGTTWKLCRIADVGPNNFRNGIMVVNDNERGSRNDNSKMGRNDISLGMTSANSPISFRSTFNRIDVRQIYLPGYRGKKWNAEVFTVLDENFRAKVLADGDRLLRLDGCTNSPCANGGSCVPDGEKHICRCPPPFTGPFCGLSLCDLNPCLFGDCVLGEKSIKCVCQLGYGGERCDRRMKPCDDNPCSGHGDCLEVNKTSYKCLCHAWWEGPQCESRMLVIPYKPLSQRMIEEPFWLGLISVTGVLGVIGLVWCLKRHFPEKLEKLLNEDLDGTRGISWVSGRSTSFRAGGGATLGMREAIPGTSQQAISPPTSRSFLGRFGIRKPSLLSLSSATSNVSVTAASPHTYENRTFSLDDLLRPSRSMMRTPSPHRRRNYSVQVRRDPAEKQQILQQLVSAGGSTSLDGESKPSTPKPTLAEIIQMSEKRLRLASASSMQSEAGTDHSPTKPVEAETSFTTNLTPISQQTKAEKKVTFARMLDKLTATELSSSSSCSDVSCAEDTKMVVVAPKPQTKKDRKGRFRRSKACNRGRNSETDQDCMDISSSDTTPDPICPPRFPTRLCISPTGFGSGGTTSGATLTAKGVDPKIPKIGSADSLLALFKRFSGGGSSSAPPSPQYSENEESSAGVTPSSTPGSPRTTTLAIKPPALLITSAFEQNNTIELPVIDPFAQTQGWRAPPATSITLEVPMRDYCLSPIHEVPTPIGTPSHSPCHTPMMMKRSSTENLPCIKIQRGSSEDDDGSGTTGSSSSGTRRESPSSKHSRIPVISISVDEPYEEQDTNVFFGNNSGYRGKVNANDKRIQFSTTGESEVIPDVLIHVPPDACVESHPDMDSLGEGAGDTETIKSPKLKTKPPPLIFANEILSCIPKGRPEDDDRNNKVIVPILNIEFATPISESLPKLPSFDKESFTPKRVHCETPKNINFVHPKEISLTPPVITINQISEAESDSDTPAQRLLHRPNLCFLSPFAGTSDRVPSESNLSTSGYSSMASPCPSRCPSASPLCPSETEDYHVGPQLQNFPRRSSLTPMTPKKPCLSPRRCSLNTPHLTSGLLYDHSEKFGIGDMEGIKTKYETEIETDSAVEVETDLEFLANASEMENPPLTPLAQNTNISVIPEEMKYFTSLLQVPKKGMPKSRSLDIHVFDDSGQLGSKNSYVSDGKLDKRDCFRVLGPSLDSKLSSMNSPRNASTNGVKIVFPMSSSNSSLSGRNNSGNLIEIPEEKERRLSPVSSRSESPLSELSAAGYFGFLGSPLTDSDGVYDCGSSEVPANNNETDTTTVNKINAFPLNRLSPKRRSPARRRDRRTLRNSLKSNPNLPITGDNISHCNSWPVSSTTDISPDMKLSVENQTPLSQQLASHLNLPPNLARENVVPSVVSTKRASPKRRSRAQPAMDDISSSSESLSSSRPRSRTSVSSSHSVCPSRNSSPQPVCQGSSRANIVLDAERCTPPSSNVNVPMNSTISTDRGPLVDVDVATDKKFMVDGPSLTCSPLEKKEPIIEDSTPLPLVPGRSSDNLPSTSGPCKISRLRTISHQIRFLRRLEMSLIRKKECLTQISKGASNRRDSILSRSDSADDSSRYDTSDSTSSSSESSSSSSNGMQDNEKPLLSESSSNGGAISGGTKHGQRKRKGKGSSLSLIENITSSDYLRSHKKRIKKYK